MNETKNNNSALPLAIIGLVLVAAIGGGWWLYANSKSPTTSKSNNNSAKKTPDAQVALALYQSAPAGAQPPNALGAPTAAVTIEEFADYQCPTCATVHTKMKEINSLYSGRIKFVFRSYPLTQIHKNAYDAATAAEAAGLQGKYWAMQDQLFTNQQAWSNSNEARKIFEEYAQKIGLDAAKFQADMLGLQTKSRVDADLERGRALAISGTPTVYINGNKLAFEQMDVAVMRQIIDAELAKSGGQAQPNQSAARPANAVNQSIGNSNAANAAAGNSVNK
jgi:protein-disulfide isomerase